MKKADRLRTTNHELQTTMSDHAIHSDDSHHVHVVPAAVLLAIWAGLVVLTVLTVGVTYVDLGRFNIALALGIATVKATLVGLYFMHLRYESPFYAMVLIIALCFVTLFIVGVMTDSQAYQEVLRAPAFLPVQP